jgi:hypothetical protein
MTGLYGYPEAQWAYTVTTVSAVSCVAVRACPNLAGSVISRNQKSHCDLVGDIDGPRHPDAAGRPGR